MSFFIEFVGRKCFCSLGFIDYLTYVSKMYSEICVEYISMDYGCRRPLDSSGPLNSPPGTLRPNTEWFRCKLSGHRKSCGGQAVVTVNTRYLPEEFQMPSHLKSSHLSGGLGKWAWEELASLTPEEVLTNVRINQSINQYTHIDLN